MSGQPTVNAPTGDHGGLKAAVEALCADPWTASRGLSGPEARYHEGTSRRGAVGYGEYVRVDDLRALLADHPEPEPAQLGDLHTRAVTALIAELGDYADGRPEAEAAEEFWGKAVDTVLAVLVVSGAGAQ